MRLHTGETKGVKIKFYSLYLALFCLALYPGCKTTPAYAGGEEAIPPAVTLDNGLRVLMRERHVTPLVAMDLWVRAGAREETAEEAGSAHFLEHVLFKGTATRGVGQADSDIENLGATLNAATGPDYAHFYTTVTAAHAPQALAILADVARNAILPDAEVERERGVILDELAQHDSSDVARAVDLLYARAFGSRPYGRSPGGTTEAIRLRGRDTLAAFYRRVYRPERCTLVLVGDLTPEQGRTWARQAFGTWTSPDLLIPSPSRAAERQALRQNIRQNSTPSGAFSGMAKTANQRLNAMPLPAERFAENGSGRNRVIGLAFPAPPASDAPMTAAALLMAEVLGSAQGGGRFASPVFAGTDAAARFTPRQDGSLWILTATRREEGETGRQGDRETAPLIKIETIVRNVLEGLRRNPPSGAEVQAARQRLLGRLEAESETNAGLAQAVGYADCIGGDAPEALRQRLQQTTPGDIQQFLTHYLLSQPGLTVYAGAGSSSHSSSQADKR